MRTLRVVAEKDRSSLGNMDLLLKKKKKYSACDSEPSNNISPECESSLFFEANTVIDGTHKPWKSILYS